MAAEGKLGGYKISGERAGTDEHPLIRKYLPIDTTVVTAVLEPGVLLKEVEVKGTGDQSAVLSSTPTFRGRRRTRSAPAPWSTTGLTPSPRPARSASCTAA